MAILLKGAPIAAAINEENQILCEDIILADTIPTLAIVRLGAREDDLSYERSLIKSAAKLGVSVKVCELAKDAAAYEYYGAVEALAEDDAIHGILLFRPLPDYIDEKYACSLIPAYKDVDGCTDASLSRIFTGEETMMQPCTAQAALEILKYYKIPLSGANVCVIGRSLVIGKPLSMLLLSENATVTMCHSKTKDVAAIARQADIVIAACGRLRQIDASYIKEGATVIDVGIHFDEATGSLTGDVDFESVSKVAGAITPVPGGVGSVTTAVLMRHVIEAARFAFQNSIFEPEQFG